MEIVETRAMELSVAVARKSVAENAELHPKVGAVLVRDGEIIEHACRGEQGPGDHAEFTLFEKKLAGYDLSGSDLFTTLEPCTYRKKHTPCAEWVITKKIARVFV